MSRFTIRTMKETLVMRFRRGNSGRLVLPAAQYLCRACYAHCPCGFGAVLVRVRDIASYIGVIPVYDKSLCGSTEFYCIRM